MRGKRAPGKDAADQQHDGVHEAEALEKGGDPGERNDQQDNSNVSARQHLWNLPQQHGGHNRADNGAAVAEDGNHLVQVLDLQAVIERVPEAMRPVKERQRAQAQT